MIDERRRDVLKHNDANACCVVARLLRSHSAQTIADAIPAKIVRERGSSRAPDHLDDFAGEFNIFASIDFS